MTYQISFSGGKGSAISALIAHENGLDFNLIFADTGIEDEDLHRFNADVARAVGKELITLKDGRTPWDVYVDRRYIGNTRLAHCSDELKVKPCMEWLAANAAPDDPLVLGMDWSEGDRIELAKARWAPRPVVSLLNKYKVYRQHYAEIFARHKITPPRLYEAGFAHNNCGGFCCKAGQEQFARLLQFDPARFDHHAAEMDKAMAAIGPTAKPFLRITIAGKKEYMRLSEFKKHIEAGGQMDIFDTAAGCGCFTD